MKQWLSTPITYGCMLRILTICTLTLLVFASAIIAAFNLGGSRWSGVSAAILTVVSIMIGLGQWLIPLPTDKLELTGTGISTFTNNVTLEQALQLLHKQEEDRLKAGSNQDVGTLLISTGKEDRGVTIYLLARGEFLHSKSGSERESNKQKKIGTITPLRLGSHLLFVARFRDLKPGRYNAWVSWGMDNPIDRVRKS